MTTRPDPRPDPNPLLTSLVQHELQERRFSALAAAVRDHEARAATQIVRNRPHDQALYRRLRELANRAS